MTTGDAEVVTNDTLFEIADLKVVIESEFPVSLNDPIEGSSLTMYDLVNPLGNSMFGRVRNNRIADMVQTMRSGDGWVGPLGHLENDLMFISAAGLRIAVQMCAMEGHTVPRNDFYNQGFPEYIPGDKVPGCSFTQLDACLAMAEFAVKLAAAAWCVRSEDIEAILSLLFDSFHAGMCAIETGGVWQ